MDWTQDQIAAVVGMKELELIALRMQLSQALVELQALKEPKPPSADVVPIKEAG